MLDSATPQDPRQVRTSGQRVSTAPPLGPSQVFGDSSSLSGSPERLVREEEEALLPSAAGWRGRAFLRPGKAVRIPAIARTGPFKPRCKLLFEKAEGSKKRKAAVS